MVVPVSMRVATMPQRSEHALRWIKGRRAVGGQHVVIGSTLEAT
jgi:hypothetical protein